MQDIPIFTTQAGVASLFLNKVAYTGEAYVKLQDTADPIKLLDECVAFCTAAGAVHVYATGNKILETYPHYTTLLSLRMNREDLPQTDAISVPVQQQTLEQWRRIYNEKMLHVPNAAYMTQHRSRQFLRQGSSFFVYRNEQLLGIGVAADDTIEAVASVVSGAGQDVFLALCRNLTGDKVALTVASTNEPAGKLYHRLGFEEEAKISDWYKII